MSELSDDAKAFLAAHADEGAPTAADALRVRNATLSALSRGHAPAKKPMFSVTKVVGGVTAAVLLGAAIFTSFRREPTPAAPRAEGTPAVVAAPVIQPPPVPEERPPAVVPPPTTKPPRLLTKSSSEPAVTVEAAPTPTAEAPNEQPEPVDPSEEFRLVAQAHASTRDGNPAWALELLTQHQRRFADGGLLTEEAHAARVKALCALGRAVDARAEAARLEQLNPSSVHLARVEHACW